MQGSLQPSTKDRAAGREAQQKVGFYGSALEATSSDERAVTHEGSEGLRIGWYRSRWNYFACKKKEVKYTEQVRSHKKETRIMCVDKPIRRKLSFK